ncbi:CRISPR-associated endonuclease Cas2 [Pleurocapsales cyanobacterium LEGE 10410]|nr:CRISPR-associated endonuclease Cas2 [Pleurocapsales cyanobacterium LEGE 10410]
MSQLLYLIIYDLPNTKPGNKRRTRLHDLLCGYGKWTQYSVFECFLTKMQFVKLQYQIENLIKPETDSVRIYVLDATAIKKAIAYGSQKPEHEDTIIL